MSVLMSVLMLVLVLTWEQDLWLLKLVIIMFMHLIMEDHVLYGSDDMYSCLVDVNVDG